MHLLASRLNVLFKWYSSGFQYFSISDKYNGTNFQLQFSTWNWSVKKITSNQLFCECFYSEFIWAHIQNNFPFPSPISQSYWDTLTLEIHYYYCRLLHNLFITFDKQPLGKYVKMTLPPIKIKTNFFCKIIFIRSFRFSERSTWFLPWVPQTISSYQIHVNECIWLLIRVTGLDIWNTVCRSGGGG